jgi:hypothetical protein
MLKSKINEIKRLQRNKPECEYFADIVSNNKWALGITA